MMASLLTSDTIMYHRRVSTAHCWAVPLGRLETNSQTELNRARRVHLRSHNAEGSRTYLLVWRTESYMIERIEELRCELQIHTLCYVIAF